jgi:hypothetical protein
MQRASLAFLLAGIASTGLNASVSIQGTVTDENQQPIANAWVTALRNDIPPASRNVQSAVDGSFQISGLPAGPYTLCAQLSGSVYLNACQWGSSGPIVTLADGQQSANNVLKLRKGVVLSVQINDPGNYMIQPTKQGTPPDLILGIWGPQNLFYPVQLTAKNAQGASYGIAIPAGTPLRFQIQSRYLNLADSQGKPLPNNAAQLAFQSNAGNAAPAFTYTITGMNP